MSRKHKDRGKDDPTGSEGEPAEREHGAHEEGKPDAAEVRRRILHVINNLDLAALEHISLDVRYRHGEKRDGLMWTSVIHR
jgi:hypothetical protein